MGVTVHIGEQRLEDVNPKQSNVQQRQQAVRVRRLCLLIHRFGSLSVTEVTTDPLPVIKTRCSAAHGDFDHFISLSFDSIAIMPVCLPICLPVYMHP